MTQKKICDNDDADQVNDDCDDDVVDDDDDDESRKSKRFIFLN